MLSWQQAAITACAVGIVGVALVGFGRVLRPAGRTGYRAQRWAALAGPFLREAGVVLGLYALWQLAGSLAGTPEGAIGHAWWLWDAERAIHLPSELDIQRWLLPHRALSQAANIYYATMHFGMLIAMLVWLFARHRDRYPAIRNAMAATTALCLFISFVPVAPPRMLSSLGFVDLAARYGQSVYATGGTVGADQLSAMPSVHVAWAVLVAWAVISSGVSRWRWLIVAHPVITVAVVVGTGNHFWADGIVASAIAALVLGAMTVLPSRISRRVQAFRSTHDHIS